MDDLARKQSKAKLTSFFPALILVGGFGTRLRPLVRFQSSFVLEAQDF